MQPLPGGQADVIWCQAQRLITWLTSVTWTAPILSHFLSINYLGVPHELPRKHELLGPTLNNKDSPYLGHSKALESASQGPGTRASRILCGTEALGAVQTYGRPCVCSVSNVFLPHSADANPKFVDRVRHR